MSESPALRHAPRRPRPRAILLGGAGVALAAAIATLFTTTGGPEEYTVFYRVTGNGTAETISYVIDGIPRPPVSGQQHTDIDLPWETEFNLPHGDPGFVSLTARGDGSGEITVRIEVDGRVVREVTETGRDQAVATADLAARPRS